MTQGSILIEDGVRPVATGSNERPQDSKSQDLLKYLKLQLLALINPWGHPAEYRKIAMHASRRLATGHALLHLVPLSSAVVVLILNWSEYFVGPTFTLSTTLQFAAKLQELLMQACIAEIILSIVRSQLIEGYLPLGALSACTQATQLSYLWSLDLLAAVTSRSFYGRRKALFVGLIPLLVLLTSLVGPSGAVLMIPRAGMSSRPIVMYWRPEGDEDVSFPSQLNKSQDLKFNLDRFLSTYTFEKELQNEFINNQVYYNKNDTMIHLTSRALHYVTTANEVSSGQENLLLRSTIAAMPTQLSAQVLYQVPIGENGVLWTPGTEYIRSVRIPRVIVATYCLTVSNGPHTTLDTPLPYSPDGSASIGTMSSFRNLLQQFLDQGGSQDTPLNAIPPIWVASPEPGSSSAVGSFIRGGCADAEQYAISDLLLNKFNESMPLASSCFRTKVCTVAAFWEPSQHQLAAESGSWVVRTGAISNSSNGVTKTTRPISVSFNSITGLNNPLFGTMLFEESRTDSTTLAAALATVFSEIPWKEQVQSASVVESDRVIEIALTRLGYGYEMSSVSTRLSLAVIMAYCIFAVGYITYMLSSGHTSTAWSSATEIIVLALQSKRSEHLHHVSAGINSIATYQEPVGIRANDRNHLELVFERDQSNQSRRLRRVGLNKAF